MENAIFLIIMIPLACFFTGIGVFAWRRKKPMWFWSGSTVREEDITDVKAYNRANGIMWIVYSLVFWVGAVLGAFNASFAGVFIAIGTLGGIPVLIFIYGRICAKYKR